MRNLLLKIIFIIVLLILGLIIFAYWYLDYKQKSTVRKNFYNWYQNEFLKDEYSEEIFSINENGDFWTVTIYFPEDKEIRGFQLRPELNKWVYQLKSGDSIYKYKNSPYIKIKSGLFVKDSIRVAFYVDGTHNYVDTTNTQ